MDGYTCEAEPLRLFTVTKESFAQPRFLFSHISCRRPLICLRHLVAHRPTAMDVVRSPSLIWYGMVTRQQRDKRV